MNDSEWGSGLDSEAEWGLGSDSEADSYSYLGSAQSSDFFWEEETTPSSKGSTLPNSNMDEEISTSTEGFYRPEGTAALTVALPLVAAIILLLLFVGLILFWKKTLTGKCSNRNSLSGSNTMIQGLWRDTEVEHSNDLPLVEPSVTSWNNHAYLSSDETRNEDVQHAEVNEIDGPIAKYSSLRSGEVLSSVNNIYNDKTTDSGTTDDQGYEIPKVLGPFHQTLNPHGPSDSSHTSESARKDSECNALDRQQDTRGGTCQTDSGYEVTERTGKGGDNIVTSNQIDNDYLVLE